MSAVPGAVMLPVPQLDFRRWQMLPSKGGFRNGQGIPGESS